MNYFEKLFDNDFMPHGHCYMWQPEVLWPHVFGDGLTALAYFLIPILLWYFLNKRKDIVFSRIFWAFAAFILFCGTTHALAIVSVWDPIYRLEGVVKLSTAAVSLGTVILLVRNMPLILNIPSPDQLQKSNDQLRKEINQRIEAERKVLALNVSLEQKVEERTKELKVANEDLKLYTSAVSHDLSTPLKNHSFVLGLLEAEKDALSKDGKEALSAMQEGVENMSKMVEGLLYLSQMGQKSLDLTEVDLNGLVNNLVKEVFNHDADDKRYELSVDDLPTVKGDTVLLREVFLNLLSNAKKYSGKRSEPKIEVGWKKRDDHVVIFVKDNGAGFEPTKREEIFKHFKRAHTNKEFEGTGVGLGVVKRIMERHNGNVNAESDGQNGSTFYLEFPGN